MSIDRASIFGNGLTTAAPRRNCEKKEEIHERFNGFKATGCRHAGRPQALLRAAQRARDIARQTNTPLVLVRDGVLVEEFVTDAHPADKGHEERKFS